MISLNKVKEHIIVAIPALCHINVFLKTYKNDNIKVKSYSKMTKSEVKKIESILLNIHNQFTHYRVVIERTIREKL